MTSDVRTSFAQLKTFISDLRTSLTWCAASILILPWLVRVMKGRDTSTSSSFSIRSPKHVLNQSIKDIGTPVVTSPSRE